MPDLAVPMRLHTKLGDDALLFRSMSASEALGRLFEFNIEALSEDGDIEPATLLGTPVTVSLETERDAERYFNGLVCAFATEGAHGPVMHRYRLVVRPWLWLLTRRADTRIFQKLSVVGILKQVFEPFSVNFEFDLKGSYPPRDYCVQYRETDFNFVSRLMEQEGIYYYFRHEDSRHTMVIVDAPSAHQPCPGQSEFLFRGTVDELLDIEPITEWRASREVQPAQVVLTDYDFVVPRTSLQAQAASDREGAVKKLEVYDYPGPHPTPAEGKRYARLRLEEYESVVTRAEGAGPVRTLAVGYRFDLTEHPQKSQNKAYLAVATHIEMHLNSYESDERNTSFECRFTALDGKEIFRPQCKTPRPIVKGPDTAVVVGPAGEEIYTDEHGRVKVQFHWDRLGKRDADSSCWIRVNQPWAGKAWGSVAIPRIGQEVMVDFLEGDPDRPVISGRLYNGEQTPPNTLPGRKMVSGTKSQTYKGVGYNEFSMDDTAGKEQITVHAQYDMGTTVEHDDTQTIHNNRTIKVDGTHTETITKATKIVIETGTFVHDVAGNTANYHVSGDLTENFDSKHTQTVGADQTITLQANRSTAITSNDTLNVGANRNENVKANRTTDITGNETLTVNGKSDTTVNGVASITSPKKIVLTVGASTIEMVPGSITLTCGPSSIKIDPTGVAITAPKISLNG